MFIEPRGTELITRYKHNYHIPDQVAITEEMILKHWELEKRMVKELLASKPDNRWEVFEQAYTVLYSELEWLNQLPGDTRSPTEKYQTWVETVGSQPQKIYEIGSGKGKLISYLAQCGFECKATEITKERGKKHISESLPNLSWGISDSIKLDTFKSANYYDVVISNQVIEHFYPEDLYTHFKAVYNILNENGRYIFGILYLKFMLIVEKILFGMPSKKIRRPLAKGLRKLYLFADNIFLTAQK
ncbi:MAG TPA: class I SAM-dependent methyltransferase [Nostocaceae cyanobacterium]|nr:class I SAM-dependent methyltransferase [Nostocaceae cyanobacterium]